MITIRDYAAKKGCTVQNIYKLIKKYNDVLKDHVTKIGSKTFLDEFAQTFLDSYITPKALLATDQDMLNEINKLRGLLSASDHKVTELLTENTDLSKKVQNFESERLLLEQNINNLKEKFEASEKLAEGRLETINAKDEEIIRLKEEIKKRDNAPWYKRLSKKWN